MRPATEFNGWGATHVTSLPGGESEKYNLVLLRDNTPARVIMYLTRMYPWICRMRSPSGLKKNEVRGHSLSKNVLVLPCILNTSCCGEVKPCTGLDVVFGHALDPVYQDWFSQVWMWFKCAVTQPGLSGNYTDIDLVARNAIVDMAPSTNAMRRARECRKHIPTRSSPPRPLGGREKQFSFPRHPKPGQ